MRATKLTTRDCADILGVSTGFIRGEIREQRLVAITTERRTPRGDVRCLYRIELGDFRRYCEQHWKGALDRIAAAVAAKPTAACGDLNCFGRAQCRQCRNREAAASRRPYALLTAEEKRRANCRAYTKSLQARGALPKGPCEGCGACEAENHHHWGYDLPRWYVRLCRDCHRAVGDHVDNRLSA